tara:strand:+ start:556 stop:660 length:105 start_codon:yes stop_codon:yes gene_type:complete
VIRVERAGRVAKLTLKIEESEREEDQIGNLDFER